MIYKTESIPDKNEIIITGVPNDLSKEPRIIAEKVFESIGMENPKSEIMKTRIAVKKSLTYAVKIVLIHQQIKVLVMIRNQ